MTTATDNLRQAALAVLEDHDVQGSVLRSSEAQYKLRDLAKAVAKARAESKQNPPL